MKCGKYQVSDSDERTHYDRKSRILVTKLPDGVVIGWDICGGCDRSIAVCDCASIRLPRHVIALRADAVRRLAAKRPADVSSNNINSDDSTDASDQDQDVSESTPDGRAEVVDIASRLAREAEEAEQASDDSDDDDYTCPDCGEVIAEDETPCPHCGTDIEWEEVEDDEE